MSVPTTEEELPPMSQAGADRGQVMVLTLMMLLIVAAISFTVLQTSVAPAVQKQTEARHYAVVRGDFQTLRNRLFATATRDIQTNTLVTMGSNYPSYLLLVQPPGPSGRLQTMDRQRVTLSNVKAADPEVRDLLQAKGPPNKITFHSRGLAYTPIYLQFPAPTIHVWSAGVVIAKLPTGSRAIAGQHLIAGRRLTVVNITGTIARGQTGSLSIETLPQSASAQTITLTEDNDAPVTLSVPTHLPKAQTISMWTELLRGERDRDNNDCGENKPVDTEFVCHISVKKNAPGVKDNRVVISLEYVPGSNKHIRYRLSAALVGLKTRGQPTPAVTATPRYLASVTPEQQSVSAGSSQRLVVEMRDRYHNPVASRPVHAEVTSNPSAGAIRTNEKLTNRRGQATFVFQAQTDPDETDDQVTVTVWLGTQDTPPGKDRKKVTFTITVQDAPGKE